MRPHDAQARDGQSQFCDAAGRVLQRGKAGFAHHALEHHAARHADGYGHWLQLFFGVAVVLGKQRLGPVLGLDVVWKRYARGSQGSELTLSLDH